MIISYLRAENVLKYATLQLDDLPYKGIIGISGSNESGKSSIGETICFALFGRTFSLDESRVTKIIRWGENACQVSLGFIAANGHTYEVTRHIDKNGAHGARLTHAGNPEDVIVRGAEPVTAMIHQLIGVGYPEFIESFYLAQREISAPHPHSDAVKSMAGVLPMEDVRQDFVEELERQKVKMIDADENHIRLQGEIEALGFEQGKLKAMESQRISLVEATGDCQSRSDELNMRTEHYLDALREHDNAKSSRGRSRFFEMLFLLLGAIAALMWGALTYFSQHEMTGQLKHLLDQVPQWQDSFQDYLVIAAAGFGLLGIMMWMSGSGANRRIKQFPAKTDDYVGALQVIQEQRASGKDVALLGLTTEAIGVDIDDAEAQNLRQRIARQQASNKEIVEAAGKESAWLDEVGRAESELADQLVEQIEGERERVKLVQSLQFEQGGHQQVLEHADHQMKVLNQAVQLLDGATENLATTFNRELRERTAELLPRLTQGRYQHVKLDEDLDVEVFSADKGDFMEFDEVSSGTQRQILLAVRLVMSQALARDCVKGEQFLFLDEPFAFFDSERTHAGLNALQSFDLLPQVWVVAQEFPSQANDFAKNINCKRTDVDLIA